MSSAANLQQREYWNGPVGERWASLQEKIDLHLGEITDALIRFAAPQSGERVLDVGCGCGTTTLLLALKTEREGAAAGIDISVPMLNVARARAMAQNADIVFLEADASTYEFQPVFDLAFSRFGGVLILIGRSHVPMIVESALSVRPELGRVFQWDPPYLRARLWPVSRFPSEMGRRSFIARSLRSAF